MKKKTTRKGVKPLSEAKKEEEVKKEKKLNPDAKEFTFEPTASAYEPAAMVDQQQQVFYPNQPFYPPPSNMFVPYPQGGYPVQQGVPQPYMAYAGAPPPQMMYVVGCFSSFILSTCVYIPYYY